VGHTEHAHDGDEIEVYLEGRPPENLRVRWVHQRTVITMQAWDDVRGDLLVRCT
jgi:hypothetical protein